ncbi:MAG: hypothetical protein K2I99_01040 [Bacteroidaceae bacterium]|nr:hypothetical protein [Bacteroidaceae bacterium]
MEFQYLIVFLILACIASIIAHHVYRRLTGKDRGCSCGSCPHHGTECHCRDTHK